MTCAQVSATIQSYEGTTGIPFRAHAPVTSQLLLARISPELCTFRRYLFYLQVSLIGSFPVGKKFTRTVLTAPVSALQLNYMVEVYQHKGIGL